MGWLHQKHSLYGEESSGSALHTTKDNIMKKVLFVFAITLGVFTAGCINSATTLALRSVVYQMPQTLEGKSTFSGSNKGAEATIDAPKTTDISPEVPTK